MRILFLAALFGWSFQVAANPFEDGFLAVCGKMVLSGNPPALGDIPGLQTEAVEGPDGHVCSFFKAAPLSTSKPLLEKNAWLADPARIGTVFDQWIETHQQAHGLADVPGCILPFREDIVTKRIYARAVSVGRSGRAISLLITRRAFSYLDETSGESVTVFGFSATAESACVYTTD